MLRVTVAVTIAVLVACGSDDGGGPVTVRDLADARGVFVGAGFVEGSQTPEFREIVGREYNSLTAPLYWSQSEPERGRFDFAAADDALAVAEQSGLRVRGHPLVWGRLALPDYVNEAESADALRAMMRDHIGAIATRYRGRIAQYDVVNEPITSFGTGGEGGDGLESYVFTRLLGPDYIREALEAVHEIDPAAKLFINDFFALTPGPKQDFLYDLASRLVAQGAPLHGVGFQGHVTPPFNPSYLPTRAEMAAAIDRFGSLGLEVEITEIDVTLEDPANQLERQAAVYRDLTEACFASPYCTGITTWGISDAYSWIEAFFGVRGAPLPFDESFEPKPAWMAIREGLVATR
jgi:endo-1,4-beta-xylanase